MFVAVAAGVAEADQSLADEAVSEYPQENCEKEEEPSRPGDPSR
jgi:hypothetical protein